MSVSALTSSASLASDPQALRDLADARTAAATRKPGTQANAGEIKKAASQFEAIILRQLLSPAIEPLMNGGLGGEAGPASSGGGVYGYMMTDVLAGAISQGGGMGLSSMLVRQFTSRGKPAEDTSSPTTPSTSAPSS